MVLVPDKKEALDKLETITRDDLATYLCVTGWRVHGEAGRIFFWETEDEWIQFCPSTCSHPACLLDDLTTIAEVRVVYMDQKEDVDVVELIDIIKEKVQSLTPEYDATSVVVAG